MSKTTFFNSEGQNLSAEELFELLPMELIKRLEVIDEHGRSYVNWAENNRIKLVLQDEGRTLKVFIGN
jgi:hypothetical protein